MADDAVRGCAICNRVMYVKDCDAEGRCPDCRTGLPAAPKKGAWDYLPEQPVDRKKAAAGDKDD